MAFTLEYFGRLKSADGYAYQAHFLQEDGPGNGLQVVLSESPAVVSWGRKGSDTHVPILGSHAEVNNWRMAETFGEGYSIGELLGLIGAQVGEWRLELRRAASHDLLGPGLGTLYWRGQILADVYEDSTMTEPHAVNVQAIDGLDSLKKKPYYDTTTEPGERLAYEGRASFLEIAQRALGMLGYTLPLRSAISWKPQGESADPLASCYVDQAAFYGEDGEAMSCYDVLSELCRRLGARLCQFAEEGDEAAWWVVSRELMSGAAFTATRYTDAGATDGTMVAGEGIDITQGLLTPFRVAGKRGFRAATGSVSVLHNHGVIPPLVNEGIEDAGLRIQRLKVGPRYLTRKVPIYTTTWEYSGDAMATETPPRPLNRADGGSVSERNFVHAVNSFGHGSTNDPEEAKADVVAKNNHAQAIGGEVSTGQLVSFQGSVNIRHGEGTEGVFNTYWTVWIEGTDWYLQRDGTWAQSAVENDRAQYLVQPATLYDERGIEMQKDVPFQFVSEPAPATGPVGVRVYGSSDYDSGIFSEIEPGYVWWDDVSVLVATEEGEALGATKTEVWAVEADGSPRPDPPRDEIKLRIGTGPSQRLPTTLLWSTTGAANAEPKETWTSAVGVTGSLDAVTAECVLRAQSLPLSARQETYRRMLASPIAPALDGGVPFVPQYVSRDVYHNVAEGEWVRLLHDAAVAVTTESAGTDPEGTTYTPAVGATGSASGVSVPGVILDPYARLADELASGSVSSIDITEPRATRDEEAGLKQGDQIRIFNPTSGSFVDAQLTADEPEPVGGVVTLSVASADDPGAQLVLAYPLVSGAPVVLAHRSLVEDRGGQIPIEAQGDLLVGLADGTPARLPVGEEGQVLTPDLAEPLGIKWADPEGGELLAGLATILEGQQSVKVIVPDRSAPNFVHATPLGVPAELWAVANLTEYTFDLVMAAPTPYDQPFHWMIPIPGEPAPLGTGDGLTMDPEGVDSFDPFGPESHLLQFNRATVLGDFLAPASNPVNISSRATILADFTTTL